MLILLGKIASRRGAKTKKQGGIDMKEQKELLMEFIIHKVKEATTLEKPYYFVKWSGLFELARSMGYDLLEIIDNMVDRGLLKKALIKTKKGGKKVLAIYLPQYDPAVSKSKLLKEFQEFIEKKN